MPNSTHEAYLRIARAVDGEFRRNQRLHRGRIQCRRGCTECCHHIFHISEIEAAQISAFVKRLPAARREVLLARSQAYLPAREAVMKQHGYMQARGSLPRPETRLACPALIDGSCAIYDHRPLICRRFGMPLHHPDQPDRIFACELNFRPGETIRDEKLIPIQCAIATRWELLGQDFYRAGGRRYSVPVTVAHAIMEDFEACLPP
jgi:Fe-S-cluster containining protein